MNKIFVIIIIFGGLVAGVFSQSKGAAKHKKFVKSVILNKKLPSVYLSFEKAGKSKNDMPESLQDLVWLRLHNNSPLTIVLEASGDDKNSEDSLYFVTLDSEGKVKDYRTCTVCSIIHLHRGDTILFTVPAEFLYSAESLRLRYSYVFEYNNPYYLDEEPTHYVFFRVENLNKK